MKHFLILVLIFLLPISIFSQIKWAHDLSSAQALSLEKGKLIVLDFTASWCKPCRTMEKKLWSNSEMNKLADNFIFVKIDIDSNQDLAMKYGVNSIPYVMVTNILGNNLWEEIGYSGNNNIYLKIFSQNPDVSQLNIKLVPFFKNDNTIADEFELGKSYQNLAKVQSKNGLKYSFLRLSNQCFKKVIKNKNGQSKEAELRTVLNLVYKGKSKKALSKLNKFSESYFSGDLAKLMLDTKTLCEKTK